MLIVPNDCSLILVLKINLKSTFITSINYKLNILIKVLVISSNYIFHKSLFPANYLNKEIVKFNNIIYVLQINQTNIFLRIVYDNNIPFLMICKTYTTRKCKYTQVLIFHYFLVRFSPPMFWKSEKGRAKKKIGGAPPEWVAYPPIDNHHKEI